MTRSPHDAVGAPGPQTGSPQAADVGDMSPEEFRRHAHEVVDWIADYLSGVEDLPVLPELAPGDLAERLAPVPPEQGDPMEQVLADFERLVVPAVTHWNHPRFHGYFAVTGSGPGILGEMLSAGLNINAMVWRASPAGTELEEHACAGVRDFVGLPAAFEGIIHDTASTSTLVALAAAREAVLPGVRDEGLQGQPAVRVYTSEQSHSSVDKAVLTLGLGRRATRHIEVDDAFRMRPDALRAALEADLAEGIRPMAIVATLGTTSTTSIDPIAEIAQIAEEFGVWLHVDAAYGGPAAALDELAPAFDGWERADSVVINPHKWLFTPIDCSILFSREPERIRAAFSLTPEYLRTREQGVGTNLMDYGVALGRRFRALKLWFVLRWFGREGLVRRIREHCRLARELADWVDDDPEWRLMAPCPLATVVLRWQPAGVGDDEAIDALNDELMEAVNRSGAAFLSHSRLNGRTVIRVSIGNLKTTEAHVQATWNQLRTEARRLHDPDSRPTR
jgi:aromatic-L-amino-acid decarboxylase